jgi:hypothetical protein
MKTPTIVKNEPAIVTQVVALLAILVFEAIGWIELGLGEWAPIVAAVLAGAGVTRSQVTPTSKL